MRTVAHSYRNFSAIWKAQQNKNDTHFIIRSHFLLFSFIGQPIQIWDGWAFTTLYQSSIAVNLLWNANIKFFHSHRFRRDMFFHTIWVCDLDQLNRNKIVKILIHKLHKLLYRCISGEMKNSLHLIYPWMIWSHRTLLSANHRKTGIIDIVHIWLSIIIDDVRATFEQFSIVCPDLFIAINHITLSYKQYFNNLIRMTCAAQGVIKVQSHSMEFLIHAVNWVTLRFTEFTHGPWFMVYWKNTQTPIR